MILDQFRLDGRIALITGASAGLGAAMAIALAEAGADAAGHGNSRSPEQICVQVERVGRKAAAMEADISQSGAALFLASAASSYIHGHVAVVDGRWMAR